MMLPDMFPKWLIATVIVAVGLEQFVIRLPDFLLSIETFFGKSAELHSKSQGPDANPTSAMEREAQARAEKAQADACDAKMQLLVKNFIPSEMTVDGSRAIAGTRTARMFEQYNKECAKFTAYAPSDEPSHDKLQRMSDQTSVTAYKDTKQAAKEIYKDFDDDAASQHAACMLGARMITGGKLTPAKLVDGVLALCATTVASYRELQKSPQMIDFNPVDWPESLRLSWNLGVGISKCEKVLDERKLPHAISHFSCACTTGVKRGAILIKEEGNDALRKEHTESCARVAYLIFPDAKVTDAAPQQPAPASQPQSAPLSSQQSMAAPLSSPTKRSGNLLDNMSRSTWGLSKADNCLAYNTQHLEIQGDSVIWNDAASRDVEHILGQSPTDAGTVTVQSTHSKGKSEAVGTQWTYTFVSDDRVRVTRNRRDAFDLVKC